MKIEQQLDDKNALRLLKEFSFGGLVTNDFQVTYIPFILIDEKTIIFHLSRYNKQLQSLSNQKALLTVLGPHAYVSSYDYLSCPQVPTWNHIAINVIGLCSFMDEEASLTAIDNMLEEFEPLLLKDGVKLPDNYKKELFKHIQCVEFRVESLEARAKLGQHKSISDQCSILERLESQGKVEFVKLVRELLELPK